jgi:hypothetical protein
MEEEDNMMETRESRSPAGWCPQASRWPLSQNGIDKKRRLRHFPSATVTFSSHDVES